MKTVAEQRLQANDSENVQIGYMKSIELAESLKNQWLAKISASPIQIGCLTWIVRAFHIAHPSGLIRSRKQINRLLESEPLRGSYRVVRATKKHP